MKAETLNIYSLLDKKKRGKKLSKTEISWFIEKIMDKTLADYQITAMLMAMFIHELDAKETAALTDAMLYSGKVLHFKEGSVIDKHSTGGVGDKTSFILAPIAAAAGIRVPMIAGRGLGHTGGTVDKIESVKGFRTDLNLEEFSSQLKKEGLVLIGQTADIAPADKIIYSLRDVTATIDSVPLITASIMSKKLAEGASGIVMDIKVGNGAFMKTLPEGRKLAKSILNTAKRFDRGAVALLTNMNQPLGQAVGHSLEMIECLEVLKGRGPADLSSLSLELAAQMIYLGKKAKTLKEARGKAEEILQSGEALKIFKKLLTLQGGDTRFAEDYKLFPMATEKMDVLSDKNGYVSSFDTQSIGLLCTELGGGRKQKSDTIDFGVGFIFHKKISDKISKNESLVTIYYNKNQKQKAEEVALGLKEAIKLSSKKVSTPKVIFEVIKQ